MSRRWHLLFIYINDKNANSYVTNKLLCTILIVSKTEKFVPLL